MIFFTCWWKIFALSVNVTLILPSEVTLVLNTEVVRLKKKKKKKFKEDKKRMKNMQNKQGNVWQNNWHNRIWQLITKLKQVLCCRSNETGWEGGGGGNNFHNEDNFTNHLFSKCLLNYILKIQSSKKRSFVHACFEQAPIKRYKINWWSSYTIFGMLFK